MMRVEPEGRKEVWKTQCLCTPGPAYSGRNTAMMMMMMMMMMAMMMAMMMMMTMIMTMTMKITMTIMITLMIIIIIIDYDMTKIMTTTCVCLFVMFINHQ